ncbi:HET-domain-containing protein [Eremomyces bilateralis CBS 781.70]|uniref:HET-domain-containing protein n=1 Tax=Eremomyces bilateralis CBS 781.70 TaxID=1392243 RepID=A0A6G1G220_9PEZI|nr:HET-domain-containing protein [Eremomyces bilateralis CBS 781.70]KAF1812032.1 HET-domain-containing protein [Eremomyces bilateralis CBS 781.70]
MDFLVVPLDSQCAQPTNTLGPPNLEVATNLDSCTESEGTFKKISNWLTACNPTDHPYCDPSLGPLTLPKRLLDIRIPGRVRLHCTDDLAKIGDTLTGKTASSSYVTLSHCWGKVMPLALTIATEPSLAAGVEETGLPQTFRDAVAVARKFSVDYIWIDSLCILQDDPADWRIESQKMGHVYGGSYFNIAAMGAANSSHGLFFRRSTSVLQPCHVSVPRTHSWFGESSGPRTCLVYADSYYNMVKGFAPLLKRGWVVQERFLSRRSIHFARQQVFWECFHTYACEDIVKLFTACALTYQKDKLPAVAGIAYSLASDGRHGSYLAGLWTEGFFSDLLRRPHFQYKIQRQEVYRAPTWSWASLDGPVIWRDIENFVVGSTLRRLDASVVGLLVQPTGASAREYHRLGCFQMKRPDLTTEDSPVFYGVEPLAAERFGTVAPGTFSAVCEASALSRRHSPFRFWHEVEHPYVASSIPCLAHCHDNCLFPISSPISQPSHQVP